MPIKNLSGKKIYDFLESKNIKASFLNIDEIFGDVNGKQIDPWDKNLSEYEKEYCVRCCMDVWYFILNVVKIPTVEHPDGVPFRLDIQNLSIIYLLEKKKNIYNNSAKYTGGTMSRAVYYLYKLISDRRFELIFVCKSKTDGLYFVDLMKRINMLLPDFIKIKEEDISKRVLIKAVDGIPKNKVENLFRGINGNNRILFINDFEHIVNVRHVLYTILPLMNYDLQVDCNSTVGHSKSDGKRVANELLTHALNWYIEMLNIDISEHMYTRDRNPFYYVKFMYYEVVEQPAKYYNTMYLAMNKMDDVINREVHLYRV